MSRWLLAMTAAGAVEVLEQYWQLACRLESGSEATL